MGEEINHNQHDLLLKLKAVLKNEFTISTPEWFENIIEAFHYSDPNGESFGYGISVQKEEFMQTCIRLRL